MYSAESLHSGIDDCTTVDYIIVVGNSDSSGLLDLFNDSISRLLIGQCLAATRLAMRPSFSDDATYILFWRTIAIEATSKIIDHNFGSTRCIEQCIRTPES